MLRSKLVEDLKREGKTGTPINPETFAVWQEKKKKLRAEQAAKKVEAELRKKKGGKGLSVLSGRDLYEYKKELFTKIDEEDGKDDIAMVLPIRQQQSDDMDDDDNKDENVTSAANDVASKMQTDLFLNDDDDDLDDIDDD
jgi:DRG Family Regulatory Proteins, Tma46